MENTETNSTPVISHKKICIGIMLGFFIKAIGASWDASYHFKHFREFYQLPHIVNGLGDLLLIIILSYLWFKGPKATKPQLKIILYGILVFIIGIGIDQWYHAKFGIDLTTWSVSHFILYTGTFISIIGSFLYVIHYTHSKHISKKLQNIFSVIFTFLILDTFWFPLLQQEQGVIADYAMKHGTYIADADLLNLFFNTQHDIYSGLPMWLYGIWVVFSSVLIFQFTKRMKLYKYGATFVALLYLSERFILDTVFHLISYPVSALPYYLIFIAFVFDIVYNKLEKTPFIRNTILCTVPIVGILLIGLINTNPPIHPPIPIIQTLIISIPVAILGLILGNLLYKYLFKPLVEEKN